MLEKTPAGYHVKMMRPHLRHIPTFSLPGGFLIRNLLSHEGETWISIWTDAEDWKPVDLRTWETEFAHAPDDVAQRCFVVMSEDGTPVATASAWKASLEDLAVGRVHWIATRKAYQGRGIGKAMMTQVLSCLARWHDRAILETQSYRLAAIRMYLNFGFEPDLENPSTLRAWEQIAHQLKHPSLQAFRPS